MTDRTAVAANATAAPGLQQRHVRRVVDAAQDSHSASTRRNYAAAWNRFYVWADREGLTAMPAMPETVAAYLAERAADGLSPASLRLDGAAIRYRHAEAGHANPADSQGVRRVAARPHPPCRARGPHPKAGRCAHGRGGWTRSAGQLIRGALDRAAEPSGPARPAAAAAST